MTPQDLPERYATKIELQASGCWQWLAARDQRGYGVLSFMNTMHRAHRFIYELLVGPIPKLFDLDHLCRNPLCVNPAHLEPVTRSINLKRGMTGKHGKHAKGPRPERRTIHCPKGHLKEAARPDGRRRCAVCERERARLRRGSQMIRKRKYA